MSGAIARGILSGTIIFGVIFRAQSSRAQLPKGNFTRQQLSSEEIAGGGNNPGAIFLVEFSADVIVRWGEEGGVNCPGPIIRGAIIQRAIVQGVNYPAGGGRGRFSLGAIVRTPIHLTTNISYYNMIVFWKFYIFAERKNTLKGFENSK